MKKYLLFSSDEFEYNELAAMPEKELYDLASECYTFFQSASVLSEKEFTKTFNDKSLTMDFSYLFVVDV